MKLKHILFHSCRIIAT